ncbi:hypothetical protein [Thiohalomonas denitrificans]|uniref:Uncharacterized protein n=1 Tax=Thiohalomonas denitrificans TaxID=415747 RepID=A0A1G5QY58_9GAMM|nr:hypothetical protein [Thiohalomonas denitrificans]SCZ66646.1 hypothetical protein SAMN03097708_02985 [Thiohalomonas denitrificans]
METGHQGKTTGESPRAAAEEVAEVAREQSRAVLEQARRSGFGIVDEQRRVFARYAEHWASAMHSAASHLEREGDESSSHYAHWAGDGLERLSRNLSSGDSQELIDRTTDFARARPAIFMGGAVLAGIALSQVFKSARPSGGERSSAVTASPPHGVQTGAGESYPRAEAEYGELETRKPGAPH